MRRDEPSGRTAVFVESVRAKQGEAYVASWLSARVCQFQDATVWTFRMGAERLARDCGNLAEAAGVTIACDGESIAHWRAATEAICAVERQRAAERAAAKAARRDKKTKKSA